MSIKLVSIMFLALLAINIVNTADLAQCPGIQGETESSQVEFVKKGTQNSTSTSSFVRFTNVGQYRMGVY